MLDQRQDFQLIAFRFPEFHLVSNSSLPALGSTQRPTQWLPEAASTAAHRLVNLTPLMLCVGQEGVEIRTLTCLYCAHRNIQQ